MKSVFTIVLLSVLMISCSSESEVNYQDLQHRKGLTYVVNSKTPFTGKAVSVNDFSGARFEYSYNNGKKDGLFTGWHWNGQVGIAESYKDGKLHGLKSEWNANGEKFYEANYKDGKLDGMRTHWSLDNGVKKEDLFKEGEKIIVRSSGKAMYDNSGEKIRYAENGLKKNETRKEKSARVGQALRKFVPRIQRKVEDNWGLPPKGAAGCNPTVRVSLSPDGRVVNAQIVKSSGDPFCDSSVKMAFFKASPLPIPMDEDLYSEFKVIDFPFRP